MTTKDMLCNLILDMFSAYLAWGLHMSDIIQSSQRCLPSGKLTVSELENGPVEVVDFPIEHGGSFHSYLNVYQKVNPMKSHKIPLNPIKSPLNPIKSPLNPIKSPFNPIKSH